MALTPLIVILVFVAIIFFFAGLAAGLSFSECTATKFELQPYDAEQLRVTIHNLIEQMNELTEQVDSVTSHVESEIVLTKSDA